MTTTNTTPKAETLTDLKKELAEALEEERLAKERVRNIRQSIATNVKELNQLIDGTADSNAGVDVKDQLKAALKAFDGAVWDAFRWVAMFAALGVLALCCTKLLAPSKASGVPPQPVAAVQAVALPVAVSEEATIDKVEEPETAKQTVSARPSCVGNSCGNSQWRPFRGLFGR